MRDDLSHNFQHPASGLSGSQCALQLAQNLIRIPSLTPVRPELTAAASASLNYLEAYLTRNGATCSRLVFKGDHPKWPYVVDNLYAEWRIGQESGQQNEGGRHLCFIGHTDVVPPGNEELWSHDPYSGLIEKGWLYGRGATDMKAAVATFCVAAVDSVRALQALHKKQDITLSLLLTTDEEWAAINGTQKVLAWLQEQGKKIDAVIVGEPSSSDVFGSHIKVGRRGSLCGSLEVKGIQGHVAYQDLYENPNRALMLAGAILNACEFKHKIPHFPKTNFELVTLVAGDFGATSIIADQARAVWNIRFTPDYETHALSEILTSLLKHPPEWACHHPDYRLLSNIQIMANHDTAAQPYYSEPGCLARIAKDVIAQEMDVEPVFDGAGGTTDGRFVQNYFLDAEIIELGLPEKGGFPSHNKPVDYGMRGGMHQVDERCRITDMEDLLTCYQKIILQYAQK